MPLTVRRIILGSAAFVLLLATVNLSARHVNDVAANSLAAWRIGVFGDLDLSGFEDYGWVQELDDRTVVNRLPGAILWAAPFYRLFGGPTQTVYPAAVAAVVAAMVTALLLWLLLRRVVGGRTATWGAALALAGTAFWPVAADGLWTHGPATMWLLLGTWATAAGHWLPAGLAFGAAILTRPHLAVVPLVQGLWAGRTQRSLRPVLSIGAGAAVGVAALLLYNRMAFDQWTLFGAFADQERMLIRPESIGDLAANVAGALVSPERGILVLSPWLVLLLPGLRPAWRQAPSWARAAAVSALAYAAVQLTLNRFSGGDGFFGNRLMIEPLLLAAPLGALAYRAWCAPVPWRRTLFALLAGVSVTWHATAAISNHIPLGARDPWRTWLQIDLIRDANPWAVGVCLVVGVAATAWGSVAAWRGSDEQGAEDPDLSTPVPVGRHPLPAGAAEASGQRGVPEEREDRSGDG